MMITTKKGDDGETYLGGKRVSKTSGEIVLLGKMDKLTSYLGVAAEHCPEQRKVLEAMQDVCYEMMAAIHEGKDIGEEALTRVEKELHEIKLKAFLRPSGKAAHIHFARALCREAEIEAFRVLGPCNLSKTLNRMSDVLFIAAFEATGSKETFRRKS